MVEGGEVCAAPKVLKPRVQGRGDGTRPGVALLWEHDGRRSKSLVCVEGSQVALVLIVWPSGLLCMVIVGAMNLSRINCSAFFLLCYMIKIMRIPPYSLRLMSFDVIPNGLHLESQLHLILVSI